MITACVCMLNKLYQNLEISLVNEEVLRGCSSARDACFCPEVRGLGSSLFSSSIPESKPSLLQFFPRSESGCRRDLLIIFSLVFGTIVPYDEIFSQPFHLCSVLLHHMNCWSSIPFRFLDHGLTCSW